MQGCGLLCGVEVERYFLYYLGHRRSELLGLVPRVFSKLLLLVRLGIGCLRCGEDRCRPRDQFVPKGHEAVFRAESKMNMDIQLLWINTVHSQLVFQLISSTFLHSE